MHKKGKKIDLKTNGANRTFAGGSRTPLKCAENLQETPSDMRPIFFFNAFFFWFSVIFFRLWGRGAGGGGVARGNDEEVGLGRRGEV